VIDHHILDTSSARIMMITKHIMKTLMIVTISLWLSIGAVLYAKAIAAANAETFSNEIQGIVLTIETAATEAQNGMYNENGYVLRHSDRPPINPDFDPDYSCLFDVYQLKCIPGSDQKCPEGFGSNDDATCFALNENGDWICPEDYHTVDDDETGQCYPNSEGCSGDMVLLTGRPDKVWDRCAEKRYLCNEDPDHPVCASFRGDDPDRIKPLGKGDSQYRPCPADEVDVLAVDKCPTGDYLPDCNGSLMRDCITYEGNFCKAGASDDWCDCIPDMPCPGGSITIGVMPNGTITTYRYLQFQIVV
jgi:hypothetical protein